MKYFILIVNTDFSITFATLHRMVGGTFFIITCYILSSSSFSTIFAWFGLVGKFLLSYNQTIEHKHRPVLVYVLVMPVSEGVRRHLLHNTVLRHAMK